MNKKLTFSRIISILILILAAGAVIITLLGKPADIKSVIILHTNDVHGAYSRINAITGEINEDVIGHDLIHAKYQELKETSTVFLLDAGDATQGAYFVTENDGEAAIDIMNSVGYDAMSLGNHEFDYGWFRLTELMAMAEFPILSQIDDVNPEQTNAVQSYIVIERDGVRLGIFGITTPSTEYTSNGAFGRDFGSKEELISHANDMVYQLRIKEKVDYVVCLSHLGTTDSDDYMNAYDLREHTDDIDVIIDGHSHSMLGEIDNETGKTVITSTGSNSIGLGYVELSSKGGELTVKTDTFSIEDLSNTLPNEETSSRIEGWNSRVADAGSTVVGTVPFDITVERQAERTGETVMGNITTDAIRAVSGADIAIYNGGNIRDQKITEGDITVGEMLTIFPYGNIIQMAEIKGSVLKEALEHGLSLYPEPNAGFLHISGARYVFDPGLKAGSRLVSVTVDGKDLEADTLYKVATNDFIAAGGDEFTMLKDAFEKQLNLRRPEYAPLEEAVIWYITNHKVLLNDFTEGRVKTVSG